MVVAPTRIPHHVDPDEAVVARSRSTPSWINYCPQRFKFKGQVRSPLAKQWVTCMACSGLSDGAVTGQPRYIDLDVRAGRSRPGMSCKLWLREPRSVGVRSAEV